MGPFTRDTFYYQFFSKTKFLISLLCVLCTSMSRQKLTLRLNADVVKQVKNLGINLSGFLEIRLSDYINYKECFRREGNPNLLVKI